MAPPPFSIMRGKAYFEHKKLPRRFIPIRLSHSSSVNSMIVFPIPINTPALLKRISSFPYFATV